jgi:hypothetical protein
MLINRKAYEERLDAQLAQWTADIAAFKARAKDVSVDGMIKFDRTLEFLKVRHAEASVHLHNLKAAGDDTWDHLRAGTDRAWHELKAVFKHVPDGA